MNLRQIKYFLSIVDTGTFLAAAESSHVSQPTLSAGIKKLEESLGVILFYRGSRSATLTAAGEIFLVHARQAYNQLQFVKSQFLTRPHIIKLGVINTIAMDYIVQIIKAFNIHMPFSSVEIEVGSLDNLEQMFVEKKLDVLISTEIKLKQVFKPLFHEALKLVVSRQNPLSALNEIALNQLKGHAFIERVRCESWAEVHGLFEKHSLDLKNVCRAESDETILSLVDANLGVSIMPERNTPYNVEFIRIKELDIVRPIGIYIQQGMNDEYLDTFYRTALSVSDEV